MKNADNHDSFQKRLVKNQVVVKFRNNEPADLRVTRKSIANAPSKFGILREKISRVENIATDVLCSIGIVSGDVIKNFAQIALGFRTEFGAVH